MRLSSPSASLADLKQHDCPKRLAECMHCEQEFPFWRLKKHEPECLEELEDRLDNMSDAEMGMYKLRKVGGASALCDILLSFL
jgi:hypothetical protein